MRLARPAAETADNIWHSHLPAIGRFLIVVTFLEDALRIITQWSDQLTYLKDYRRSRTLLLLLLLLLLLHPPARH